MNRFVLHIGRVGNGLATHAIRSDRDVNHTLCGRFVQGFHERYWAGGRQPEVTCSVCARVLHADIVGNGGARR